MERSQRSGRGRRWIGAALGGWSALAALLALAAGCRPPLPTEFPKPPQLNPDYVQRGGILFIDKRVSGDGTRSCQSCHAPESGGRPVYRGGEPAEPGSEGARVAPSLRGLFTKKSFFWDASGSSLEAVIDRMLAVEMRGGQLDPPNKAALIAYLRSLPAYDNGRIQPDGTPIDPATISQRSGYATFMEECSTCHPPAVFRRSFPGKFDIGTGTWAVPSLRGLPREGPYGHDGRWPTLEAAVAAILENRKLELNYRQRLELIEYLKLL